MLSLYALIVLFALFWEEMFSADAQVIPQGLVDLQEEIQIWSEGSVLRNADAEPAVRIPRQSMHALHVEIIVTDHTGDDILIAHETIQVSNVEFWMKAVTQEGYWRSKLLDIASPAQRN